jgi:hypothetical protein
MHLDKPIRAISMSAPSTSDSSPSKQKFALKLAPINISAHDAKDLIAQTGIHITFFIVSTGDYVL